MRNGYYLYAYIEINEYANYYKTDTKRHDQNISLWKYSDGDLSLVRYWELERLSRIKHHNKAFSTKEQFIAFINQLLSHFDLDDSKLVGIHAPPYFELIEDRNFMISDEYNYHSLCHLFSVLFLHGAGAAKITRILMEEKVSTPAWVNFQRNGTFAHVFEGAEESKRYQWTIAQVKSILKDENYIGNSVHNRQSTVSFKNKKVVRKPESEWFRVENTHEAIITKEVFLQVQEQIAGRRRVCKNGQTQIFAGLIKCADCGWTLSYADNRQNKTPYGYYHCGKNGQGLGQCSMHYIRYDVLYGYVLSRLQYWSEQVHRDDEKLLQQLLNAGNKERSAVKKQRAVELKRATKRKAEVDGLFTKLYEDWSLGKITEYNFTMLSERFQTEQRELETKIRELQEALSSMEQTESDAEKWVELIKQYASPTELTTELLNTLIEKIVVHEAVKSPDGCRKQKVDIYYRFIGKID